MRKILIFAASHQMAFETASECGLPRDSWVYVADENYLRGYSHNVYRVIDDTFRRHPRHDAIVSAWLICAHTDADPDRPREHGITLGPTAATTADFAAGVASFALVPGPRVFRAARLDTHAQPRPFLSDRPNKTKKSARLEQ